MLERIKSWFKKKETSSWKYIPISRHYSRFTRAELEIKCWELENFNNELVDALTYRTVGIGSVNLGRNSNGEV